MKWFQNKTESTAETIEPLPLEDQTTAVLAQIVNAILNLYKAEIVETDKREAARVQHNKVAEKERMVKGSRDIAGQAEEDMKAVLSSVTKFNSVDFGAYTLRVRDTQHQWAESEASLHLAEQKEERLLNEVANARKVCEDLEKSLWDARGTLKLLAEKRQLALAKQRQEETPSPKSAVSNGKEIRQARP